MAALWSVLSFFLFFQIYQLTAGRNGDKVFTESDRATVPMFSPEPMSLSQCALQFTANCQPDYEGYDFTTCPLMAGLEITCNTSATSDEIRQMTISMAKPPLRAVSITFCDGNQVGFENIAPVQRQIFEFALINCVSSRATGKVAALNLPNLLEFDIRNCRDFEVEKADFASSRLIRWIEFVNTTIRVLEKGTFSDLPALRLLSLESQLNTFNEFSGDVREYIKRIHCSCEFKWFRRWWDQRRLLHQAQDFSVYQIQPFHLGNPARNKSYVYLPVDCAADSFPAGTKAIDFAQDGFSINDDADNNKWRGRCNEDTDKEESFPQISIEPLTPEECAIQVIALCGQLAVSCDNDTPLTYDIYDEKMLNHSTNCTLGSTADRIRRVATAMIRLPVRPATLALYDKTPVTFDDVKLIRQRILVFNLAVCIKERASQKLQHLRLTNLIEFVLFNCSDLIIQKSDFQFSQKLRIIELRNTTVRALEVNTFSGLPELSALSLEMFFNRLPAFDQRIRTYLYNLHCSCEFAWYRKWWSNNSALLREAEFGGIFQLVNAYISFPFQGKNVYVPIDCAQEVPLGPDSVNWNQTEFSLNDTC
ncbi:uncharacterized protein LOC129582278 [Paramacrobiotus metropolitanus]|uniref:uncharacterized protein LOC129582278 n=1 Tax=Paramacrobiotus metropolitanus TaxID=2943436 RepID=UPI0024456C24|nr:uncharacterized protein LOC129582278 [Paramacrobiotus metropolitanus]